MLLPLTWENETRVIKFYIIPRIVSDVIFGIDFWLAFNLAPDILRLRATYSEKTPPFVGGISDEHVHSIKPYKTLSNSQRCAADATIEKFLEVSSERIGLGLELHS